MKAVDFLGCGLGFGEQPDFGSPRERWGVNKLMFMRYSGEFDAWTRWFDLHSTPHILRQRPEAYAWYQQQTKPIYRWEPDDTMSSAIYPLRSVQRFFADEGHDERDFGGSFAWMMALAILEGFEQIDVWWMPLDPDSHGVQLPSARYWIGQARGRGVRVTIHGDSALTASGPLYGKDTSY